MVDHSLEDLLQLVADGQPDPFGHIYDRTSARVFGAATSVVRDRSSAEDVTREVFVDVWQLAGGFDRSAGSALEWMMLLTRSRSIECLRRRRSVQQPANQQTAAGRTDLTGTGGLLTTLVRQGEEFLTALRPITPGLPFSGLPTTM